MLQSIANSPQISAHKLILHKVALVDMDADLVSYLSQALRQRWPKVRLSNLATAAALERCDLAIFCEEPPVLSVRRLWLSELTRTSGVRCLGDGLWRTSMPITRLEFIATVERVFQAL
jgi:hypothetical protein